MKADKFIELPPQGYAYLTDLQRLDYKIRCGCLDTLRTGTAGTWNISQVLQFIMKDLAELGED